MYIIVQYSGIVHPCKEATLARKVACGYGIPLHKSICLNNDARRLMAYRKFISDFGVGIL